jgi:hypothetical protein
VTVAVVIPPGCLTVSYLLYYYWYKSYLGVMYYVHCYWYDITEVCKPVTTVGTSGPVVGMTVVDAFVHFAEVASNFHESVVTCLDSDFVVYAPPNMFV